MTKILLKVALNTITLTLLDLPTYRFFIYRYITRSVIYPAMTAFTEQYSLPNIVFDIGQL
jgi:hypothetical protein